jgi:hypothetical protein
MIDYVPSQRIYIYIYSRMLEALPLRLGWRGRHPEAIHSVTFTMPPFPFTLSIRYVFYKPCSVLSWE